MQVLWAPWRMEYILSDEKPGGCIFCEKPAEGPERHAENLVLACSERSFVMLNRYPYSHAHLLVVPRSHTASLASLAPADLADLWRLVSDSIEALEEAVHPEGMNLGMNFGRVAGAGVADHLHVHLVPRWNGDTNFMPVTADVRVMPEHLRTTYERLREVFARRIGTGR